MKERNNELEEVKWGGLINEFFWICAGVNRKILRQCPTDYAKYAGIGGTILFTALMAMLSGGYAMFSVFNNHNPEVYTDVYIAIGFGVLWGLLIFNLDRFIVNTMYSDGKASISWFEFFSGLPRIIMAIFLGIVISTPLELKIFEDEINIEIEELKQEKLKAYTAGDQQRLDSLSRKRDELAASPLPAPAQTQVRTGNEQIDNLNLSLQNKQAEYQKEVETIERLNTRINALTPTSTQSDSLLLRNLINDRYQHVLNRNRLKSEMTDLTAKLGAISGDMKIKIDQAVKQREAELQRMDEDIAKLKDKIETANYKNLLQDEFGGFQAKMHAFSKMRGKNSSTNMAAIFIMLLFIIIETAPTFFKMMIAAGPYDDLLRSESHKARVMADKRISDMNDEINTEILISTEKNKNKLEAEVAANKELLNRIALVQAELLTTAIEKWRVEELKKIEENPSAYIKTGTIEHEK